MNVVVDDENEIRILKQLEKKGQLSIYSLIDDFYEQGIDPERIVSSTYYLAGRGLLKLEVVMTEDGAETMVSTTPLTQAHLKHKGG